MTTKGYRLRIKRLDFISAVDAGAQGPIANVALIKRAKPLDPPTIQKATCKVFKLDEKLGLVFGWAMAGTLDGGETPHVDHQDDAIDVTGDDFIKACAEFMEGGAASDVMHDGRKDGRIVFAMPLVKGVNEALGIKSNVEGFAIAMKPSAETFKRFVSGELAAFSIGGIGEREPLAHPKQKVLAKHLFSRVLKDAVLTSESDGHQHALDLDDPATSWCSMYQTSYQTLEGAENSHSHAWTFDATTGAITIAADSGHTHALAAGVMVPADALAAWAKLDALQDAENMAVAAAPVALMDEPSDGVPSALPVEESSGKIINVVIAARAAQSKSTHAAPVPTTKAQPETKPMNLAKMLALLVAMTPTQQAHVAKLAPDELEPFFTKSATDRTAILKAAEDADAVIFKGEVSGIEVRKSDGANFLTLAKQNEANAVALAKREAEIEKSEIRKQATEVLAGMPGDDDTHDYILASLRKAGDPVKSAKSIETLTGMRQTSTLGKKAPGLNGGDLVAADKQGAYSALEKALIPFAKEKGIAKVWTDGLDAFAATPTGAVLVKAYDDAKRADAK